MKKVVFTLMCTFVSIIAFSQVKINYSENQLIIKFKEDTEVDFKNCLINQKFNHKELDGLNVEHKVQSINIAGNKKKGLTYILNFKTNQDINEIIKLYQGINLFEYVEPNYIGTSGGKRGVFRALPNDAYFSRQYGLYNDGSFSLSSALNDADIDMDLGWDIEQGSRSITVAILDSGLKLDHPEFSGRIRNNSNEIVNGIDDDNNGYIDDIEGWNFADMDNDPTDDHGHGTNVTGIIGANANNNVGYAGVDWNCQLMICKILDDNNYGLYTWWTDAIYYAVDNGANVINMSVGGSGFSGIMQEAINYAYDNGVIVVACMMNENSDEVFYPAGYQNTIAVGSTDANDQRSSPFFWNGNSGSNYGDHLDVVAPGNHIYGLSNLSNTNYNSYWGGTSQATPLVTGLSSLLLAQDPNRSPDDIREIIRSTAEDQIGDISEDALGFDNYYGYGRINAHSALSQLMVNVAELNIEELNLSVFPNPSSEYLFINSDKNYAEISIVDILGSSLYRKEVLPNSSLVKVDISDFPKGVYTVQVLTKDRKKIASKKVIIQ